MSYFEDIENFHLKFDLAYDGSPRELPDDIRFFREEFLMEELTEYLNAETRADKLDALVDLVYVAIGNAYLHGFNFDEAWRRVHEANMQKVRAAHAGESKRNNAADIVKPEGWVAPELRDLCDE